MAAAQRAEWHEAARPVPSSVLGALHSSEQPTRGGSGLGPHAAHKSGGEREVGKQCVLARVKLAEVESGMHLTCRDTFPVSWLG